VVRAATKYGHTPEQVMYQYMHKIGVIPLSGTKSVEHMLQDVAVFRVAPNSGGQLYESFTLDEVQSMTNFFVRYATN